MIRYLHIALIITCMVTVALTIPSKFTVDRKNMKRQMDDCTRSLTCANGVEIHSSWVCNGLEECTDGSDEAHCEDESPSSLITVFTGSACFTCANGILIHQSWECDGQNDCSDGSDETNCGVTTHFSCDNGEQKRSSDKCDCFTDCSDWSDEADCPGAVCFSCADGNTIPLSWECDGMEDCSDGQDEANCGDNSNSTPDPDTSQITLHDCTCTCHNSGSENLAEKKSFKARIMNGRKEKPKPGMTKKGKAMRKYINLLSRVLKEKQLKKNPK